MRIDINKILGKSSGLFRFKWAIAAVVVAATVFFALQLPKLRADNNTSSFLPVGNEEVRINDYYNSERFFGSTDTFIIGLESSDALSSESLTLVRTLRAELLKRAKDIPSQLIPKYLGLSKEDTSALLGKVPELGVTDENYMRTLVPALTDEKLAIETFGFAPATASRLAKKASECKPRLLFDLVRNPVKKVRTVLKEDYVEYRDEELVTEELFPWGPIDAQNIAKLRDRVDAWTIYDGFLVSKDRTLTSVIVEPYAKDAVVLNALEALAEQIIAENPTRGIKVHLGGEVYITSAMDSYMNRDVARLFPLVIALMALTLFFFFRSWQGVVFPFAGVAVAIVVSMGTMSILGITVNIVTSAVPILLMCVIAAYGVHQMSHYYVDPNTDKLRSLGQNMETVGIGLLLSGLTTLIGFATLVSTPFNPIREFGIVNAIGILVGLLAAMYFIPSLVLIDPSKKKGAVSEVKIGIVEKALEKLVSVNRRHPGKIVIAFAVFAVLIGIQAIGVRSDFNPLTFFRKSDPVRIANETLGKKLSGTQAMNVVLDLSKVPEAGKKADPASDETILTPEILRAVDGLAIALKEKFPETVGRVSTINDLLKKINLEMNDRDPAFDAIPESRELISQYMLLFSGDVKDFVSTDSSKLNVIVTLRDTDTSKTDEIRKFAMEYVAAAGLPGVTAYGTGTGVTNIVANDLMVSGTVQGLIGCVIITFLLLLPLIRNIWMTLIAMIPIFFMLLFNFGVLGFFGITFDMGTSIVSSVAIGLGIDFSIHFISWYRHELAIHRDAEKALDETIVNKGRAIIYNLAVVAIGFLALLFSSFVPLANFGLLVSLCVLIMALGSLMLVPATIRLLARKGFAFTRLGTDQRS